MADSVQPLVELRDVTKTFGSTRALTRVSFDVRPGEVHVVAGENGAGKSTLIRIMAGALTDFEGELHVGGRRTRFRVPDDATRAGIATIHQELSLIGSLSVLDNLLLPERALLLAPYLPNRQSARARQLLAALELELDPRATVESLPLSVRQLIEVARALSRDARVLVMDEPTSALSEPEAKRLFSHVRRLREEGKGIVYISHRMEEIFQLADRITVLRDGARVLTLPADELDEKQLVEEMVGRSVETSASVSRAPRTEAVLEVRDLTLAAPGGSRETLSSVSFSLQRGEVLGVAGLQGAGASELLHAVYGSFGSSARGELEIAGARVAIDSPEHSVAHGVILLASDRGLSVLPAMSVCANATLSSLRRFSRGGLVRASQERDTVSGLTRKLRVAASSLDSPAGSLSGGNQQKVALARCLLSEPRVLLLDDPTRGIDVAAKADVHTLVRELAAQGTAVLLVASELDELASLCDRVLVLVRGRLVRVVERGTFDRAQLLAWCMGQSEAVA